MGDRWGPLESGLDRGIGVSKGGEVTGRNRAGKRRIGEEREGRERYSHRLRDDLMSLKILVVFQQGFLPLTLKLI